LLVLAALLLFLCNEALPLVVLLPSWVVWLIANALLLRGIRLEALGPVFLYDVIHSSRRGEQGVHRTFYGLVLAGALFLAYLEWFPQLSQLRLLEEFHLPLRLRAQFAASFFAGYMACLWLLIVLFTPLYVAGAISDLKERNTLEHILVTDLSDREIILGYLGARLAKLILLIMTGLPILSLLPLLGGVDPLLVVSGTVGALLLTASLGSLSILQSVRSRTTDSNG
jgi:hypothetical protein